MLIGSGSRSLKSEVRSMKYEVRKKQKIMHFVVRLQTLRPQTSLSGSYIYSGRCNFFFVDSLIQKAIYESPKNSPGLCYPDDGAFIL